MTIFLEEYMYAPRPIRKGMPSVLITSLTLIILDPPLSSIKSKFKKNTCMWYSSELFHASMDMGIITGKWIKLNFTRKQVSKFPTAS